MDIWVPSVHRIHKFRVLNISGQNRWEKARKLQEKTLAKKYEQLRFSYRSLFFCSAVPDPPADIEFLSSELSSERFLLLFSRLTMLPSEQNSPSSFTLTEWIFSDSPSSISSISLSSYSSVYFSEQLYVLSFTYFTTLKVKFVRKISVSSSLPRYYNFGQHNSLESQIFQFPQLIISLSTLIDIR